MLVAVRLTTLLLITRIACWLLVTWRLAVAWLIALLVTWLIALLVARWTRFALLLIAWRLTLFIAWWTNVTLRLRDTRGRLELGGSGFAFVAFRIVALVAGIILIDRRAVGVLLAIERRKRIAIRITSSTTATATTTTATATFTGLTWVARMTGFARMTVFTDGVVLWSSGHTGVLRQIRNRSGIEHFRFSGGGVALRGDEFRRSDFFRLVLRNGSRDRRRLGTAAFGARGAGGSRQVSGQHSLQGLDEVILAEAAAVLDLMFTSELSEVFDAEGGEIRLIRHGSNNPAQNAAGARRLGGMFGRLACCADPSWAWARR